MLGILGLVSVYMYPFVVSRSYSKLKRWSDTGIVWVALSTLDYSIITSVIMYKVIQLIYRRGVKPGSSISTTNLEMEHTMEESQSFLKTSNVRVKKGKTILLVGDAFPPKVDGVSTFSEHALRYLPQMGHVVHVITGMTREDYHTVYGIHTEIDKQHVIAMPTPRILWLLLTIQPDVVHIYEFGILSLGMCLYCQFADIPVCFSHHTRLDAYAHIWFPSIPKRVLNLVLDSIGKYIYVLADAHLCVNPDLVSKLKSYGIRARLWTSGSKEFDASSFRDKSRDSQSHKVVLHVGRLAYEKDSQELVEFSKQLWKLDSQIQLHVVGGGEILPKLKEECSPNTTFLGVKRGPDLFRCYANADVFFSPSTTEAFPLVFVEAMRAELPVCGPDEGGVKYTFEDKTHGRLFESHNMKDAVDKIQDILLHHLTYKQHAYSHALQYTWKNSVDELESTLMTLV
ncbi:MAG: glycosyltransferase [Promethearchaeota archaeon]